MKNITELPTKKNHNKRKGDKILKKTLKKFSVFYGPERAKEMIEILKETIPSQDMLSYKFQFSFDENVDRISDESMARLEEALREYKRKCVDDIYKLSKIISNLKIENMHLKEQLGISLAALTS